MTRSGIRNLARPSITPAAIDARVAALPDQTAPRLRELRRELSRALSSATPDEILSLANALVERGGDVDRFFAYEIVATHTPTMKSLTAQSVRELGKGINTWVGVDTFACYVSGPAWREGRISDAEIARWARSTDRWWRRAALVSTVPLNVQARGGSGDSRRTLAVCRKLVSDRDPMVWKALSWALRSLIPRDPDAVREFLRQQESSIGAPVRREVTAKLTTGLKNPRKAGPKRS